MNDLLNETPLSQLVTPNQRVVRLEHNLSIGDALKVFSPFMYFILFWEMHYCFKLRVDDMAQ